MGESNENLLKAIRHYQESLDRHTENRNENKLLHYLDRLYKLPIKVAHLEQTGVGRTVNGLRKLGGEVGEFARRLVTKWKEMVVGEQEEEEDEDDEDGYQTGEEQSSDGEETKSYEKEKVRENSSSHRKSDKSHNGTDDRSKVRKSRENSSKSSHSSESKSSSEKDRHKENGHDRHRSHKRKTESDSEDEGPKKKKQSEDESRHKRRVESDSDEEKKSRDKKHKRSDKSEKKKSRESSLDAESDQETKSKERRHKYDKKKTPDSSDDESDEEMRHREKRKSEKYKSLDKPSTSKDSHKDKHKHSKREDSKRHEHSSKTKENDRKSKHKSEDKERVKDRSDDKKEKKKKVVNGTVTITGIDSGSGTSFAEALGMCEPSSSKGTSKKKPSEKKDKPASKSDDPVPKLLLKEPEPHIEPLDLNLSSLLPPITPNYRPLGNLISSETQHKKFMSESETLASIITSKNQRTKVYSGNKVGGGKVPTLFELCTRILQDNIDALEYTGGVPYLILKPILEKATPNQLYVMEHHNPYLIEDTDELWQGHCQKEFRNKHRLELETWREMYLRCLDERDAKLKALTANIKQSQDKSLPVRMTKLAYVDAVAKPPRNIARKQAKNGTAFDVRKPSVTPSSRLNALATAGEAGKVAVPNPGSRAIERTSGHSAKPKKAPLMLKSISSFKNRFKR